jgi:hypothetical protein
MLATAIDPVKIRGAGQRVAEDLPSGYSPAAMDALALRKAISRQASALRRADRALAAAARLPEDLAASAYFADEIVRDLDAALGNLESSVLGEIAGFRDALRERVQNALADAAARLAAQVAERLSPDAPVTGQLPELRWGLLRLEFQLAGPKRAVVIWYGPRVAALARVAPEPDAVAEAARAARADLDRAPLEPEGFLRELREAYEGARRRRGAEPAAPVPILEVLRELCLARQSSAFRADPVRDHFRSYGRVQFSYDLYRAGPCGPVSLGVAAHAQTRNREDHLWVPTGPNGEGTHYATLAVRER